MAHEIFISYAAEDKTIADAVCEAIEADGITCWYAPRDVAYGQDFEESIVDAIGLSRLIILILTSNSNTSAHVKREIQNACMEEVGVPVLPFRVEDIPLSKALKYYIGSVHWLDAITRPLETHLQRLVEHIHARLPRPAKPPETENSLIEKNAISDSAEQGAEVDPEKEPTKGADDRLHDEGSGSLTVLQPQVPNYLAPAIVASVFCCLPVGVTSLAFAMQATSKAAAGEIEKAVAKARLARTFLITAIVLGLAAYLIFIVVMIPSPNPSRNSANSQSNKNGQATNINRNPAFPLAGLRIDIFYLSANRVLAEHLYDKLRGSGAQVTLYQRTDVTEAETTLYYFGEEADNAKKIASAVSDITAVHVSSKSSGRTHSDGIQFYLWVGKGSN
jgi:hypothetical protein